MRPFKINRISFVAILSLATLISVNSHAAIISHDLSEFALFSNQSVHLQNRFFQGFGLVGSNSDISATNTELPGIRAGGSLTLGGTVRDVNGDIIVNQAAYLGKGHDIFGDVHSSALVSFDDEEVIGPDNKRVVGTIKAKGDVVLPTGSLVVNNIETEGSVELKKNSQVENDILAAGNVTLMQSAEVGVLGAVVGGNVTTNGTIDMRKSSVIHGDARADGDILMSTNAAINGDAAAGGTADNSASGAVVNGTITNGAPPVGAISVDPDTFQLLTLPSASVFSVGLLDFSEGTAGSSIAPLAPGQYGNLTSSDGLDIYLTGGTYTFNSIDTGIRTDLYLDLSAGNPIEILVAGDALFGVGTNDPLDIFVSTDGSSYLAMDDPSLSVLLANLVSLEALGTFRVGINGMWFGSIYTPNEGIEAERLTLIGAAYAGGYIDGDSSNHGIRLTRGHQTFHTTPPPIPEPSAAALCLLGMLVFVCCRTGQ